ncbi:MAG: helix-turn-helix domain-containing protein [Kordiimonadaceae bacterium]|nr:helix-turn-helix domain-containing protein [Kordiimonadaceae bacterium]
MKFGDFLKVKRENVGWTQPDAAARAQIEQSYLSKLETGKRYPSDDVFQKLAKLYAIDVAALVQKLFASELDELREIRSVRTFILARQQRETTILRSWLLAGLFTLVVGSGLIVFQVSQDPTTDYVFWYRSEGVTKPNERMEPSNSQLPAPADLVADKLSGQSTFKVELSIFNVDQYRGWYFLKDVKGGTRLYQNVDSSRNVRSNRNKLLIALGAALIGGGLGCFHLCRRWA